MTNTSSECDLCESISSVTCKITLILIVFFCFCFFHGVRELSLRVRVRVRQCRKRAFQFWTEKWSENWTWRVLFLFPNLVKCVCRYVQSWWWQWRHHHGVVAGSMLDRHQLLCWWEGVGASTAWLLRWVYSDVSAAYSGRCPTHWSPGWGSAHNRTSGNTSKLQPYTQLLELYKLW